ncbi:MAG: Mg chelatase, subunit ChlI [Candidatus Saccharibacteria bacterium]|nr:Mg chelatase, subunit ChlI [Candidatus Saccharibacteria bacterium]
MQSITSTGASGIIVDIECHLSNNLPNIIIVGFANKAVNEARERIRGAFATSRIMLPRKRVIINLAPADVPKADSGFDLAIAVAILVASDQVRVEVPASAAFIGELGLDGNTRAVRGIIGKILVGRARGINTFYVPAANLKQAQLVPDVVLVPIQDLAELFCHLNATIPVQTVHTRDGKYTPAADPVLAGEHGSSKAEGVQLGDIVGQLLAKRALEIAAAGGHNILLSGPPGTGKSMLAKAMPSILPPLNREEVLEVTHLHSLASHDYEQIISQRPFRAPHHGASTVAVTGGGSNVRPGELSLAHRGILFFDEFPEFSRTTLESLRQPLEDRIISVSRATGSVEFPANFILVATANPCPCGYYGTPSGCHCAAAQKFNYQNRFSGPIMDRIDLSCDVHEIDHTLLLAQPVSRSSPGDTDSQAARKRIIQARKLQSDRLGPSRLNTDMSNLEIKQLARLEPDAIESLNNAARTYALSARAYMRTIKVARTIADLEASPTIYKTHMSEALALRPKSRQEKHA